MKDNKYKPNEIEPKWQKKWESDRVYSPDIEAVSKSVSEVLSQDASTSSTVGKRSMPFYNLMMFPYPSAEGLHVGNMYAFTGADIYGRFKRMQGNEVFEPIGLDGFGIHSENYALKVGRHPAAQAEISEKNFYRQLRSIGNSFDFTRTVETYNPDYYQWTQWLFIQMFKNGLAYRKKAEVNWCPSCMTVLSDEQVIAGLCERCGSKVQKKDLEQWFFRITKYAQRLLDNLDDLDWTERVKIAQRNWIGRSEGAEVEFEVIDADIRSDDAQFSSESTIKVFTTRPDTLYGATFLVVAPEHRILSQIKSDEVKKYIAEAKSVSEIERTAEGKEKTGVFTGLYAINPVNGKQIPIWVADYVLGSYGTGAIMAVPAHDQRDFEFAKKYNLEIIPVIQGKVENEDNVKMENAYLGQGIIIGSDNWDGFHVPHDMQKVITDLESRGIGTKNVQFHLRDWLISRQRYWGPPIPMIYCEKCAHGGKSWFTTTDRKEISLKIKSQEEGEGSHTFDNMAGWYPVSDDELPVKLPEVEDWKPMGTGKAPLANHPEFYETTCPECGSPATRETDVSDTFLDSAWYFLRYPNTDIENEAFDIDRVSKWLPVDMYIGGAEHSVLHLLYSRFVTMVLSDLKLLSFEEPFSRFYAHGLIIKDGAKMSKSKGNVVVPDEYINKYGADSLRTYLMFLGPYSDGGDFKDSGIEGIFRYLKRVWRLFSLSEDGDLNDERIIMMNKTIKKVTEDIASLKYNTAIASLMEWHNELTKTEFVSREEKEVYLKLLSPFAVHLTEELWSRMGNSNSIHTSEWPQYDENKILSSSVTIVVQINGKRRGEFELEVNKEKRENQSEIEKMAKETANKYLEGKEIKKTIYVRGKIVNFVI